VTNEFPDNTVTIALDVTLYGARNIGHAIAGAGLRDAFIKGFFRDVHKALRFHTATANRHGAGRIANKPIVNNAYVQADDVAKFNPAIIRQPMHDLFVY
jgi:hypothetical protein